MTRRILYVNTDDFHASAARLREPSLKGRPLAVGSLTARGSVLAASYEARGQGVRPGLTWEAARRLCPELAMVQADGPYLRSLSQALYGVLERFSPLVERSSPDEAYLDLTGTERLLGPAPDLARRLRREIRQRTELDCSVGLGASKLVSRVAAGQAKRAGLVDVFPGYETRFLAPLPVRRLPGTPGHLAASLERMGVRTIGELARVPAELMGRAFGAVGLRLAGWARGEDPAPVRPRPVLPHLEVTCRFDPDVLDTEELRARLYLLTERLGRKLRRQGRTGRRLTLEVRYSDGYPSVRSGYHPRATDLDPALFETAARLLTSAHRRRVRVRILRLRADRLEAAPLQLDLFPDPDRERMTRLQQALDQVHRRYREPRALTFGRAWAAVGGAPKHNPCKL